MHPATLWEAVSDAVPDRIAVVQGTTRASWRRFEERSSGLAGGLLAHGVGRGAKVGQLLYNSPEFLESYFAALKVRAVPFNMNYRYTAVEIAYLLADAEADALVYHAGLAEVVAEAVGRRPVKLLIEVPDADGHVPGSIAYEDLVSGAARAPRIPRDGDDVTMVYTGGTTGMPKGVVSKVGPTLEYLLDVVPRLRGRSPIPIDEVPSFAAACAPGEWITSVPASPLMHNTGLAVGAFPPLATGGSVVLLESRRFDAAELWDVVHTERVTDITVVGDPFARPMVAELEGGPPRDLTCVRIIGSAGAMLSGEIKARLLRHLPGALIVDVLGASEGMMGMSVSTGGALAPTGSFQPLPGTILIAEDGRRIEPGSAEVGFVAVPGGAEGYHRDARKTAATFRVIDGERYTVPGDFATMDADGTLHLLGRGSSCINTGGEKVFAEEVEEALKALSAVEDALVFGVDDERFGQNVAAVLSRPRGSDEPLDAILAAARQRLAGYKVPRVAVVVDEVPRTPVGKADYPGARALLERSAQETHGTRNT
jgi:acyl-CoA synthetase (AMP-forming)/AMP-acid ligase II